MAEEAKTEEVVEKSPAAQAGEHEDEVTKIVDGCLYTEFKGKPIVFHPLTLRDTSELTQLKGKLLRKLTAEGELINESMIEPMVAKRAKEMGIPKRILDPRTQQRWFQRMFDLAPKAITEGDKEGMLEGLSSFADELTDEEFEELGYVNAVVGLRNTLNLCTVENQVASNMLRHEMVRSARTPEGEFFWETVDKILEEADNDLEQITMEFRAWKSGRGLDFLLSSPRRLRGKGTGPSPKATPAKSSEVRSSSGRRTKRSSRKSAKS